MMTTPQQRFTNTFSAAACVAPIVLWSEHSEGNVYLAGKNTFLEFYTDEKKAIKRNACARSASCDSSFKEIASSGGRSTAPSTNWSPSQSLRSFGNSESDSKSRQTSPDDNNNAHANYQCQGGSQYYDASYDTYDATNYDVAGPGANDNYGLAGPEKPQACTTSGGYPVMMMPVSIMPNGSIMMMPGVTEQDMQSQPKVVKPPKKQDLKELNTEPVEEVTTLMVRGIPCSFSQDTLMKLIDDAGLQGKYDFFYLPRAGKNGSNLGYAFINFTDKAGADHCMASFNGVPLDPSRSTKVCAIAPGDIQGLANLRKHFRRTAVSRGSRGPVFLKVSYGEESQQ